jgi:hypothetical protein
MIRMVHALSAAALLIGIPAVAIAQPETTPGKEMQKEEPGVPPGKKTDQKAQPGASEYAPGQQKDDPSAPGKSESAPGQTTAPGSSENAPPRNK